MSLSSIGVIFPSRGMVFNETFKELLEELSGFEYEIYWSHGVKIPDCFNNPLKKALKGSHSHILIVEEDMVLRPGTLKALVEADEDIITCDYPVTDNGVGCVKYDKDGNALFSGTGFMLIKTPVLEAMPKPVFRTDIQWNIKGDTYISMPVTKDTYGKHDINFGLYHYMKGHPITISSIVLAQRKLVDKGASGTNVGMDNIKVIDQLNPAPRATGDISFVTDEAYFNA